VDKPLQWEYPPNYHRFYHRDDLWGFKVVISSFNDPSLYTQRYYTVEEVASSVYGGRKPGVILCEDELTGTRNPAAPNKPFGRGLYWSPTRLFEMEPIGYGASYHIKVLAVNVEGVESPDGVQTSYLGFALNLEDPDPVPGGRAEWIGAPKFNCTPFVTDICCPEYRDELGRPHNGENPSDSCDGFEEHCPQYNPSKFYSGYQKSSCGWLDDYPPPPTKSFPWPTPFPTLYPTSNPTALPSPSPTTSSTGLPAPSPTACKDAEGTVVVICKFSESVGIDSNGESKEQWQLCSSLDTPCGQYEDKWVACGSGQFYVCGEDACDAYNYNSYASHDYDSYGSYGDTSYNSNDYLSFSKNLDQSYPYILDDESLLQLLPASYDSASDFLTEAESGHSVISSYGGNMALSSYADDVNLGHYLSLSMSEHESRVLSLSSSFEEDRTQPYWIDASFSSSSEVFTKISSYASVSSDAGYFVGSFYGSFPFDQRPEGVQGLSCESVRRIRSHNFNEECDGDLSIEHPDFAFHESAFPDWLVHEISRNCPVSCGHCEDAHSASVSPTPSPLE